MPGREHDSWRHEDANAELRAKLDKDYMHAHRKAAEALKKSFGGKASVGGDGWSSYVVTELEDGNRYYFTIAGNTLPKKDNFLIRFSVDSFRKGSDGEARRRLQNVVPALRPFGKVGRPKTQSNKMTTLDAEVEYGDVPKLIRKLPAIAKKMADGGRKVLESIEESADLATAAELVPAIERAIRKHFPKSSLRVAFKPSLKPSIQITFAVAGGKDEVPNGIMQNDLSYTSAFIWGMDKEGNLGPKLQFDPSQGGTVMTKPPEGSHLAFGSAKVGLRKKTGTPAQVLKHVDTYFTKLLKTLKANKGDLPDRQVGMLKSVRL